MLDTLIDTSAPEWKAAGAVALAESCAALIDLPVAELDDETVLNLLRSLERLKARIDAEQMKVLARLAELRAGTDLESTSEEVAARLGWSAPGAARQMGLAETLTQRLPETLASLKRGEIDLNRARAVADVTEPLSEAHAQQVEHQVLPRAAGQNPAQLRRATRRAVAKADPEGAARRCRPAPVRQRCRVQPRRDGVADLTIRGATDQIAAAYACLDERAQAAHHDGDERTLDQLRADIALGLILGRRREARGSAAAGAPRRRRGPASSDAPHEHNDHLRHAPRRHHRRRRRR